MASLAQLEIWTERDGNRYAENLYGVQTVSCPDDAPPGVVGWYPFHHATRGDVFICCELVSLRDDDRDRCTVLLGDRTRRTVTRHRIRVIVEARR